MIAIPPTGPTESLSRGTVYLPIVRRETPNSKCFDDIHATELYNLLQIDSRQQHPALVCCPSLVAAAKLRSAGLANGDPWAHVDAHGVTPNQYARNMGCHLPAHYATVGNNIESLLAGTADAAVCLQALGASPAHAAHLFGLSDFFRQQSCVGISMAEGGEYGFYWCILIAVCEG